MLEEPSWRELSLWIQPLQLESGPQLRTSKISTRLSSSMTELLPHCLLLIAQRQREWKTLFYMMQQKKGSVISACCTHGSDLFCWNMVSLSSELKLKNIKKKKINKKNCVMQQLHWRPQVQDGKEGKRKLAVRTWTAGENHHAQLLEEEHFHCGRSVKRLAVKACGRSLGDRRTSWLSYRSTPLANTNPNSPV